MPLAFDAKVSFLLMTMINVLLKRKEEFVPNKLKLILCGATSQMWSDFERAFSIIVEIAIEDKDDHESKEPDLRGEILLYTNIQVP